jgi:hypothetical protein
MNATQAGIHHSGLVQLRLLAGPLGTYSLCKAAVDAYPL